MKKVAINITDFKELIEGDYYYVDKTEFIQSLIESHKDAISFPRPRRFGKTLTMSMLENFFSIELKEENKDLFKGLYIESTSYYDLRGTKPVIRLSLKDIEADNFESFYNLFEKLISNLYKSKDNIYESLDDADKKDFDSIRFRTANQDDFKMALADLITYMKKVYKSQVVLLIDEYDVPIQRAYSLTEDLDDEEGYYKKVINFLKTVFSSSAKDNDDLYIAVFTGVLRVSQESIFSDLNNFEVYGLMNSPMKEYFGFTEEETKELLKYYGLELNSDVKEMYDGYLFNGVSIYNPWSILKYVERKNLEPYWVNTSGNNIIKEMIKNAGVNVKTVIEGLVQGNNPTFTYDEKLTYKKLRNKNDVNSILNMMFASGYLTFDKIVEINGLKRTYVKIPNKEVQMLILDIMEETISSYNSSILGEDMLDSIVDGNLVKIEQILNDSLLSLSYMDLGGDLREVIYHVYTLAFFKTCLNSKEYIVKSNRESGNGRSDVMIERVDRSFGYVFEFKITQDDEDMEIVARNALDQIEEKEYYKELVLDKVNDIRKVSIVFSKKKCIVR